MAQLTILEYPDPRLRARAQPVRVFDAQLSRLIDDMFETLYATRGMGLAATQVGEPLQLVTIDLSDGADAPQVFINPAIVSKRRIGIVEESCLSVPGISEKVKRATELRVRALDRDGTPYERQAQGLLAVCLQHEIDHLDGRLFVDHLSFFRRLCVRQRLAHARRQRPGDCAAGAAIRV